MPQNWIHKLNESNSRLHKEDVVRKAFAAANLGAKDANDFLVMAWYAYNPFNVYHTTKVPITNGVSGESNNIEAFIELLLELTERKVTGHAAIAAIERASLNYDSDLWNTLLRPTILKDFKVGATVKTFNKILKKSKYAIPIFECQLATDSAKHPKKLTGKKILEPKLDGIRCLAIIDKSFPGETNVTLYSRNGKLFSNFPHIEEQLKRCMQLNTAGAPWSDNRMQKFVFDGEIVSENFQALMKQAQRKTNIDTSDSVYSIFDVIPLDQFNAGQWNMIQSKRSNEWLGAIRDRVNDTCSSLHIMEGIEVDLSTEEGKSIMDQYAHDQIDLGYEGIMIKDPDAPYLCKRRTDWMKWKPNITVDLEIVGFEAGEVGGRNEHRLGAIVCAGVDDGKDIKVNVGGGYSDKQRDEFWANKEELLGHIVEIRADCFTKSDGKPYSLRFPRFVRFRGEEAGEKI